MSEGGGGVQGMPYVLNLLYFEGCVTMDGLSLRNKLCTLLVPTQWGKILCF